MVDGVQFGDLIEFVDFDYIARVTRVNAAALVGAGHLTEHAQERARSTRRRPRACPAPT